VIDQSDFTADVATETAVVAAPDPVGPRVALVAGTHAKRVHKLAAVTCLTMS
jgi:hypothetical protein